MQIKNKIFFCGISLFYFTQAQSADDLLWMKQLKDQILEYNQRMVTKTDLLMQQMGKLQVMLDDFNQKRIEQEQTIQLLLAENRRLTAVENTIQNFVANLDAKLQAQEQRIENEAKKTEDLRSQLSRLQSTFNAHDHALNHYDGFPLIGKKTSRTTTQL